jgi:hypothetical protein
VAPAPPQLQRVASVDSSPREACEPPPRGPGEPLTLRRLPLEGARAAGAMRYARLGMHDDKGGMGILAAVVMEEDDDGDDDGEGEGLVMCCQPSLQDELQEGPSASSISVELPRLGVGVQCSPLRPATAPSRGLQEQHSSTPQGQRGRPAEGALPAKYLKSIDLRHVFPAQVRPPALPAPRTKR